MRFQSSGKYVRGVADVDPSVTPATVNNDHVLRLPETEPGSPPARLLLNLLGAAGETLTVDLFLLVDETNASEPAVSRYVSADHKWVKFAVGTIITVGTLAIVTVGLPAGGVIYAQRTGDTFAVGVTRVLTAAWS